MVKSVLPKFRNVVFLFVTLLTAAVSLCFVADQDWITWGNKCLNESYDPSTEGKIKKWELNLTDDSFIRFRKTFQNGKQEYFSFFLQKLDSVDYIGNVNSGTLELKAKSDDIIVQTYNDRHGNVDSMTNVLRIPLKNMEPERLDSLERALAYLKTKGL